MNRKRFVLLLAACFGLKAQKKSINPLSSTPPYNPPAGGQYGGLTCPVCRTRADKDPVTLAITGDGGKVDGSRLALPTVVCQRCGVLYCVWQA